MDDETKKKHVWGNPKAGAKPSKAERKRMVAQSLALPTRQVERLRALSRKTKVPQQAYLRMAIDWLLDQSPTSQWWLRYYGQDKTHSTVHVNEDQALLFGALLEKTGLPGHVLLRFAMDEVLRGLDEVFVGEEES